MALYIPHSIFNLARLLYVKPETFRPYCVYLKHPVKYFSMFVPCCYCVTMSIHFNFRSCHIQTSLHYVLYRYITVSLCDDASNMKKSVLVLIVILLKWYVLMRLKVFRVFSAC